VREGRLLARRQVEQRRLRLVGREREGEERVRERDARRQERERRRVQRRLEKGCRSLSGIIEAASAFVAQEEAVRRCWRDEPPSMARTWM
jgi:hypothetical protein